MSAAEQARERAQQKAQAFVREEAGFAQVTTLDVRGFPVARSMTAFLEPDWSIALVQRRVHHRMAQMRRDPHVLVTWVGDPAPGATNDSPHVFDLGRLPSRVVLVRATTVFMDQAWTRGVYAREITRQRAQGHTKAPLRTPEQVDTDLVGVRLEPYRVRLEGFGEGAQSFDWTVTDTDTDTDTNTDTAIQEHP